MRRDPADLVELGAAHRNVDMKDFGNHAGPAIDEVGPAVLDLKRPCVFLSPRLIEENQVTAIVQVPHDSALGEKRCKTASLSSAVGATTYSHGTSNFSSRWIRSISSSLPADRFDTMTFEGRSAPRSFCIRCQVSAMVEPPAPIEKTSAPVLAK